MVCDSCEEVVERVWVSQHFSLYCAACIVAALWVWRLQQHEAD